ncbi:MAG: glycosyltransferase [Bdellovibrionales bacterium]|nr:glycosyltransferase [Bdellovibrionales bacterium]
MKGRIVTYFKYPLMNVHLHKDVGQVLKALSQATGLDAALVGFWSESIQDFQGITVHFLKRTFPFSIRGISWSFIKYVLRFRSEIALLQLYFMSADSLFYAWLFKKVNPQGKVYLKLDAGPDQVLAMPLNGFFSRIFLRSVDLISAESQETLQALFERAPGLSQKLAYVPNGLDLESLKAAHPKFLPFEQKENRILILARVGLPEKNHEFLLRLIPKVGLKDWKWVFVGPVQPGFQEKIDSFFTENPSLKDQVLFVGEIRDRAKLYAEMDRAKIAVSTSRRESFQIALLESLVFGHQILVSDQVGSAKYVCRDGKSGTCLSIDDETAWVRAIQKMTGDQALPSRFRETQEWALQNLSWEKALEPVLSKIAGEK